MDDELENFIRERKARVAADKACLQQDPPYMEMKAKPDRGFGYTVKENIPPKSKAEGKGTGHGLPLGVEYERKKQRLQQELRMDYRRYMAQVTPLPTGDRRSSSALPHIENIGAREREMPPPEQAHVAFQSPLLEYSSSLGLGGGGLSPSSQPAIPSFPVTSMDILRYFCKTLHHS
uniref:Centrosome and spindle pole associated protein 1a n=1 Tax=Amphilophus citrinellus TaxID=61819 RepID=A0A3Q0SYL9_AMPCI